MRLIIGLSLLVVFMPGSASAQTILNLSRDLVPLGIATSANLVLQNFTVDYQPLPFTQVRVMSVDVQNSQIQYTSEPGWQNPSFFNSVQTPPGSSFAMEVFVYRNGQPAHYRPK